MIPQNRSYSTEHEWVRLAPDGLAIVGITEYAQEQLGDVVFIELPETGIQYQQFDKVGEIESVKAVSDLYIPLGGIILITNDEVTQNPERINESPYEDGWLFQLQLSDPSEMDKLLTPQEYEEFLANQK